MDAFWDNPIYSLLSTWTEPEALYEKKYNELLFTASHEYIWPKKIMIFMYGLKSATLAIFQKDWYGTF